MFYGAVIKAGKSVLVPTDQGQVLHLSQACLNHPTNAANTYLQLKTTDQAINLCSLSKNKCEHASFDIFFHPASGVRLVAEGPNDIHVAGYFEPDGEGADDDEDDDEEEHDEEGTCCDVDTAAMEEAANVASNQVVTKTQKKANKLAKQLETMMAAAEAERESSSGDEGDESDEDEEENEQKDNGADENDDEDSDDDNNDDNNDDSADDNDEEDDDSDDDNDDEDDDDSDDDDDEDIDMDTEAVMKAVREAAEAKQAGMRKRKASAEPEVSSKRPPAKKQAVGEIKPQAVPAKQPSAKPSKPTKQTAATASGKPAVTGGSDDSNYQKSLVDYLKAHGRTTIATIGGQVKRPAAVKKLGAFIKERPSVFKMEGQHVTLMK